jgi:hypothetical protein
LMPTINEVNEVSCLLSNPNPFHSCCKSLSFFPILFYI